MLTRGFPNSAGYGVITIGIVSEAELKQVVVDEMAMAACAMPL